MSIYLDSPEDGLEQKILSPPSPRRTLPGRLDSWPVKWQRQASMQGGLTHPNHFFLTCRLELPVQPEGQQETPCPQEVRVLSGHCY